MDAYVTLGRITMTYHGMTYQPRGLRSQRLHSSRRSNALPGRWGKPAIGRRKTGNAEFQHETRYAKGKMPGFTWDSFENVAKIEAIINALRQERYHWKPVRRVYIPKRNSNKKRALGLPTWSDKLLQEVIRLILHAYFEPSFSDHSHGFRPQRGCHTALKDIYQSGAGVTWYIEGDISACCDSLSHDLLLEILAEHIHDGRFLRLICELLKAGYSRIDSAMQRKRRQGNSEEVKRLVGEFLKEHLKLELSKTKTLITHGRTEKAKFLGYEISTFPRNDAREQAYYKRRVLKGKVELGLPAAVIQEKCQRYMAHNKPIHRTEMLNDAVFSIITHFQGVYRGIVEYYRLAHHVYGLNKLKTHGQHVE